MSHWMRSKIEQILFSLGKASLFCFARGQTIQRYKSEWEKDTSAIAI